MKDRLRTLRRRAVGSVIFRILRMPVGHHDYTVTQTRVRMRDGVELLTDVYTPDAPSLGTVLIRTPYGRTGLVALLTAGYYATHGYHVVNQSCRGTFGSGGVFEPFSQEIADGADAVAWLRRQPWFGGRFALCGASYLGYTAWALMMEPPPELVAAVIAVSAHDNHWGAHGAGAFSLEEILGLMDAFGHLEGGVVKGIFRGLTAGRRLKPGFEELPLVRAQETVLAGSSMPYLEWLTTPDPEDPLWRPMRLGQALERADVPVLLHDGWQDRFPDQMIGQYEQLRRRGVDVGLTIGPWTHLEIGTKGAGILMTETLDWLGEHLAENRTSAAAKPGPHLRNRCPRVALPADVATSNQRARALPTAQWRAQRHPADVRRRPDNVHLRSRRSHSGSRRPDHQPGTWWLSRQPKARGTTRRPDVHQPTADRTAGSDREPDRRGGPPH